MLVAAGDLLTHVIVDELAPHWLGTTWDFNGMTEVPRRGDIACGYLVSTLLRDAGAKVRRIWLAQQGPEAVVRHLVPEAEIRRFTDMGVASFANAMGDLGDGLYVIGLDNHVGFVACQKGEVRFVHSSYIRSPDQVVNELAEDSVALMATSTQILGRLSTSEALLRKWLEGELVR